MAGQSASKRASGQRRRAAPAGGPAHFAYVGSFTTEKRRAKGDGIHGYRMSPDTGRWTHIQHVGDLVNPSWFTVNRARTVLYVGHGDESYISAFAIDATGQLKLLNQSEAGGRNILRTMLDPSERFLISANSGTANVTVLAVAQDGSLGDVCQTVPIPGGPRPRYRAFKQETPHPHDIHFDQSGRWVMVPDRGMDRVFILRFDSRQGQLTWATPNSTLARPGAGPRHVAIHPTLPVVWVLNEQDSTVTTCRWNAGRGLLNPVDVAQTLPGDYTGDSITSEIVYCAPANALYVSNRGHNSIAIYRVDKTTGLIRLVGWERRGIAWPRFIGIDPTGRFLYSANEKGHTVTPFRIERRTGTLVLAGRSVPVASPACIAFA